MKPLSIISALFLMLLVSLPAFATADGLYSLTQQQSAEWDGTIASRLAPPSADYDFAYGDEASVTYTLPWSFTFYGQTYSKITADTNGNIWLGSTGSASSFSLAANGKGPVIAAWNNDQSSYLSGGVFIQHKINPERVVIEWQSETYTDEGLTAQPNNFEVVLSPNGDIRVDYKTFTAANARDFGSGISNNDGTHSLAVSNISGTFIPVYQLGGLSYSFATQIPFLQINITGSGSGTVSSNPAGIACGATCVSQFATSSTVNLSMLPLPGSIFTGWSGACSGTGICTVTMDSSKYVMANFYQVPPPTVSITSPSGITNINRPTLLYNVSDGTVVVKVDGIVVNAVSGSILDTLSDGAHLIRVEATNSAGSVGFAETTVVIDTKPPTLTANAVAATTIGYSLTLSGTIEAGAAINISSNSGAAIGQIVISSGNWSCVISNMTAGLNTFTISATDQAGNTSTVSVSTTCIPPLTVSASPPSASSSYQSTVDINISYIKPSGSEVLVEQYIDTNRNGLIDAGDYVIRSFKVRDGIVSSNPNIQGDTDGTDNGIVATSLGYLLNNDLYHAPGHYIFKATSGSESATTTFVIDPVNEAQTVSGTITDGTIAIPGAMVHLLDKWQRQIAWTIADESGVCTLNVKQPGDYYITPIAYGYVAPSTPVTLSANQSIVNQTLTVTAGTYHVAGKVMDVANSTGIGGVWVQAREANNTASVAITSADGSYDLMLPAGQYSINSLADTTVPGTFSKGYTNFNNHPLNITVNGNIAGMDFALTKGDIPVSGRVLDPYGNPIQGLAVEGKIRGAIDVREPVNFGFSDAAGNYSLGLFAGTNWDIFLDNSTAQPLGYVGTITRNLSTAIGPLTGQNLTVHPITAWIQGTVKDSTNKLLSGVEIQLRNADSSITAGVFTALDGTYRLGALAGIWYINALTAVQGLPAVPEQTVTLSDAQTATNDFMVDIAPPSITITSPSAGITNTPKPVLAYTVSDGAVVVKVDGVIVSKLSGDKLDLLANGQHTVRVESTDTYGNLGYAEVTFTVNYTPLAISTATLTDGYLTNSYNQTLFATGGISPYTAWSIISATKLPTGLTLAPSGVISGVPSATVTNSSVTFQVIDSDTASASKSIAISVYALPSITTTSLPSGTVGVPYGPITLTATGGKISYTWSITSATKLPIGLTLDQSTGIISGTPSASVTNSSITFQVADANGKTASKVLSLTIAAPTPVAQLNAWTNLYSAAPNNTGKTNLAAGSFTVGAGTNRLLLVAVVMEIGTAANPIISASYGGTALTQIKITNSTQKEIVWVGYLKESLIGSGSKALTITYSGATGNVSALHVKWASFSKVNQNTPVVSSGGSNTASTSATFGSVVNYVANGMTTVVAGNGGTPATGALSATPTFTAGTATTTNAQTSRTFTTAKHTAAGSYANTTPVTWTGTTSAWSGLVAVSLQP